MGAIVWPGGSSAPSSGDGAGCGAVAPRTSAGSPESGTRRPPGCCRARRSRRGALAPRWPATCPCSGMGRCRRRFSWSLTSFSFARIRFEMVMRLSLNRPFLRLRTDVREPEEVERLRLPETPGRPVRGGEAPELDQPGLVGVQLQAELRESLAKVVRGTAWHHRCARTRRRSRRRTARRSCRRGRAASSTAGPTGRRRSGGTRWRAAAKPMPPAVPPPVVSDQFPSSMTPALSHFWMRRRTRLSAMRCSRNFISQPDRAWRRSRGCPRRAPSSPSSALIPTASASSASCGLRPGRNP